MSAGSSMKRNYFSFGEGGRGGKYLFGSGPS